MIANRGHTALEGVYALNCHVRLVSAVPRTIFLFRYLERPSRLIRGLRRQRDVQPICILMPGELPIGSQQFHAADWPFEIWQATAQ